MINWKSIGLKELAGFIQKEKYFQHKDCPWFIEFISSPVAVGSEPIHNFTTIGTELGLIKMLSPTDSVKDRLASFYHWNDKQALQQAADICLEQSVDFDELERWSIHESHKGKFQFFRDFLSVMQRTTN